MLRHIDEIIEDYYKQSGSEMEYEKFRRICRFPFNWLAHKMRDGNLSNSYRFIYFGRFSPLPHRINQTIERILKRMEEGSLTWPHLVIPKLKTLIENVQDEKKRDYLEKLSRVAPPETDK